MVLELMLYLIKDKTIKLENDFKSYVLQPSSFFCMLQATEIQIMESLGSLPYKVTRQMSCRVVKIRWLPAHSATNSRIGAAYFFCKKEKIFTM